MAQVGSDALQEQVAATASPQLSSALLASSAYLGYATPKNGAFNSDAAAITKFLAQGNGYSPSLTIRSGTAIDQVQMTLTDKLGNTVTLFGFGGGGGTSTTLDAAHIQAILQVSVWGTNKYDTPRLGQITITYTGGSGYGSQTFGSADEALLGTFDVQSGTLAGFTGSSGTMVDGLSFIVAAPSS